MRAPERIAFGEFTDRRGLTTMMRRGFEAHIRQLGLTFDYRTEPEWDQDFQQFRAADRRRRHG